MMKKLLFIICLVATLSLDAQATINIDWDFGSNPTDTSPGDTNYPNRTVEVGDTVIWTWTNSGAVTHTVTSSSGSSETFDSGNISGQESTFSYTFTQVGSNPYRCIPHPSSMNGTITVVAEGTLSTPTFNETTKFDIAPNPSKNWLNVKLSSFDEDLNIEVFDVLGKRVHKGIINQLNASINVASWNTGIYLVRVSNDKSTQTKRFIKQ